MKTSASLNRALELAALARRYMTEGASLEKALEAAARGASPEEKAACQSLTYAATRHALASEAVLAQLAQREPEAGVRAILLVAIAELIETPAKDYMIVNEAVKAVKNRLPAAAGFANACLRRFARERGRILSFALRTDEVRLNAPRWWIDKMRATLGRTEADAMMQLVRRRPPLIVRVNLRKTTVSAWCDLARNAGHCVRHLGDAAVMLDAPVPVAELPGFADGLVSVQDAGAQLAAIWLAPRAGERVLDACAAPGGKTAHLLELADCRVTALEVDPVRAGRIHENLDRLGLSAEVIAADAGKPEHWNKEHETFDAILLDAPCTASGIVRRHPDIVFSRRPEDVRALSLQQKRLLEALWPLVRVGGRLLYVVCSVFEEEGKKQIEAFLQKHPEAALTAVTPGAPLLLPLTPCEKSASQPAGVYDTHDGFFYALLTKKA